MVIKQNSKKLMKKLMSSSHNRKNWRGLPLLSSSMRPQQIKLSITCIKNWRKSILTLFIEIKRWQEIANLTHSSRINLLT